MAPRLQNKKMQLTSGGLLARSARLHQCAACYTDVTVVATDAAETIAQLRRESGKDIWLCGGGNLFRSLLAAGQVDTVELGVSPLLLGRHRDC